MMALSTPSQSSATTSEHDDSSIGSGPEDDLVEVNPRKKRRLSPTEKSKSVTPSTLPDRALSRIKVRKLAASSAASKPFLEPSIIRHEGDTFESIDVQPWLVASLANMAITRPTGIQRACIPEILKGRNCIGGSRTGSGKTVAFAVPILQNWAQDPIGIFAVVLTPTRYFVSLSISHSNR
jgi:ATP-dependent RNA helicase DDX49/DBP8